MIKSIVFLLYLENLSNNISIISFYFGNLIIRPSISYFVIQYIKMLRGICQPQLNVRWMSQMYDNVNRIVKAELAVSS